MPGYKGHLVGGAVAFSCMMIISAHFFSYKPSFFTAVLLCVWTLLGSLFPDVDTKSRGQGIFYRIVLILIGGMLIKKQYMLALTLSTTALLPLLVAHRGLFHKPWFLLGLPFGVLVLCHSYGIIEYQSLLYGIFFMGGALSHLICDKYV